MNRELRTYTLTVVVESDDEMWHAYCQPPQLAFRLMRSNGVITDSIPAGLISSGLTPRTQDHTPGRAPSPNLATILPISRKCTVRAASCRAACARCSTSSGCVLLPDLLKALNPIHRLGKSTKMVSCSAVTRTAAPFRLTSTSPTISKGIWSDLTSVLLRERGLSTHH
jgi:hypothetical protein